MLYLQLSPELIMEALTQLRSLIYFATSGGLICALTILSPRYGSQSIMIDLGLVAIYGKLCHFAPASDEFHPLGVNLYVH